jgi:hypothetical protein
VVQSEKGKALLKAIVPIWKQDLDAASFKAAVANSEKALEL